MKRIGAVILAAGQATRFGSYKQVALLDGKPLFLYAVELAIRAQLEPVVVVSNDELVPEMAKYLSNKKVILLRNHQAKEGISTSLKTAFQVIEGCSTRGAMLFLGDQPFIPDEVVQRIIMKYEEGYASGIRIVRALYSGEPGHPVFFDSEIYRMFEEIEGDTGAKDIMRRYRDQVLTIDFPYSAFHMDIDTPEDYERAKALVKYNGYKE